jgi:hypothetical protein
MALGFVPLEVRAGVGGSAVMLRSPSPSRLWTTQSCGSGASMVSTSLHRMHSKTCSSGSGPAFGIVRVSLIGSLHRGFPPPKRLADAAAESALVGLPVRRPREGGGMGGHLPQEDQQAHRSTTRQRNGCCRLRQFSQRRCVISTVIFHVQNRLLPLLQRPSNRHSDPISPTTATNKQSAPRHPVADWGRVRPLPPDGPHPHSNLEEWICWRRL